MILPKVVVIVGPTASGKTALSLKLAKKYNGEIVSADSRQVYRGMDIGTAKPPILPARRNPAAKSSVPSNDGTRAPVISQGIPHYLIDIKNPNQDYSLAQYKKDAIAAINEILHKGKLPFLVGGTGLYISTLTENWEIPQVRANKKLRAKLENELRKHGVDFLYRKLVKMDPEAAYIVDPKNPRRIIRALEIMLATKRPFSAQRQKGPRLFDSLILGVAVPKNALKQRIFRRAQAMYKQGLAKEVQALTKKYGRDLTAFDAIGYREIISYLKKEITLTQSVELMNKNTWRFAKRQMTWFKKMPVKWVKNYAGAVQEINKFNN